MSVTTRILSLAFFAGVFAIATVASFEPPAAAASSSQDSDVKLLQRQVRDLTDLVAEQGLLLQEAQKSIETLDRLGKALVEASRTVGSGVETSRQNGFEAAGPNPQAKTDLLDCLRDFAQAIETASRPPKKAGDDAER